MLLAVAAIIINSLVVLPEVEDTNVAKVVLLRIEEEVEAGWLVVLEDEDEVEPDVVDELVLPTVAAITTT